VFTQRSLGIDDGADILLQMIHSPYSMEVENYPPRENRRYVSVANLLTCNDHTSPDLETYKGRITPNRECITYLLELCNDIKKSPTRLAQLLVQIAKFEQKLSSTLFASDCIVTCRDIMTVVREHYLGENKKHFIPQLYELARVFKGLRDFFVLYWDFFRNINGHGIALFGRKEDFSLQCTQVINGLTEHHITSFGVHARRSVACVRPAIVHDAAIDWLGMHDGEKFRPQPPNIPRLFGR
jgi:hypothetical protein